jgi:FlaA1/EpsC-like NDP-sugar epimerase
MLLLIFLLGARLAIRYIKESSYFKNTIKSGKRILIVGAGSAGEGLARDMLRNASYYYYPVAFVDDRQRKHGQEIHGIRILGGCQDIPEIVKTKNIEKIVFAIPSANSETLKRIFEICKVTNIPISTLPSLKELVSHNIAAKQLRKFSLEDLLGRDPISLDWQLIGNAIQDKVVLVTGAGGSIGSEVCRQIIKNSPKELIALDMSEFNLFSLEQELISIHTHAQTKISVYLIDVRDSIALERIIFMCKPDIVFHAAAYKHVPLLEHQCREAIYNNVIGTYNLAKVAISNKVQKVILVSTDKAVNPTNIMGASKRIAEIICQNLNYSTDITKFITVRFGNVLGSAGSVVPIFQEQIKNGGPVKVTHPEITRFFMTIPEAAQLILQAFVLGNGGEIYVLDMGTPIKIRYLAEKMIELSGKEVNKDIEIQYTGLRPGEKLFEELFHEQEALEATTHTKILRAGIRRYNIHELIKTIERMKECCIVYNTEELLEHVKYLVPELSPPSIINDFNPVEYRPLTKEEL